MLIREIREAIPNKDLDYELDFLKRIVKLTGILDKKRWDQRENYLLLGCALARAEIAETYIKLNYPTETAFLKAIGIRSPHTARAAKRFYFLLVEKGILPHQIDELNKNLHGYVNMENLYVQIKALRTKEECLQLFDLFYEDQKRKKRLMKIHGVRPYFRVIYKLKRKYGYGDMTVDFRTADLFSSVRDYLKELGGGAIDDIEIVKCLAVKALIEKPTEKKVVSWCRFYGIKPIYATLLLGAINSNLDPHYLSFAKLTAESVKANSSGLRTKKQKDYEEAIKRTIALFGNEE